VPKRAARAAFLASSAGPCACSCTSKQVSLAAALGRCTRVCEQGWRGARERTHRAANARRRRRFRRSEAVRREARRHVSRCVLCGADAAADARGHVHRPCARAPLRTGANLLSRVCHNRDAKALGSGALLVRLRGGAGSSVARLRGSRSRSCLTEQVGALACQYRQRGCPQQTTRARACAQRDSGRTTTAAAGALISAAPAASLAAGGAAATSAPASAGAALSSACRAASRRSSSTCLVPVWSRLREASSSRSSCVRRRVSPAVWTPRLCCVHNTSPRQCSAPASIACAATRICDYHLHFQLLKVGHAGLHSGWTLVGAHGGVLLARELLLCCHCALARSAL
jgi:hypothetical protein